MSNCRIRQTVLSLLLFFSNLCYALPEYSVKSQPHREIHLLEFDPNEYEIILVHDLQMPRTVSSFVEVHHAIAGINGGFFRVAENLQVKPIWDLKIDGTWLNYTNQPRAAIGWREGGKEVFIDIIKVNKKENEIKVTPLLAEKEKAHWQTLSQIVSGTPVLIKNGKKITDFSIEKSSTTFKKERHARTAVCIKPTGNWVWVVVSHTKEKDRPFVSSIQEGFTLAELADFLEEMGCRDAINLDGGGSSTLVYENKIKNQNAGDFDGFLGYQERPVVDALVIKNTLLHGS